MKRLKTILPKNSGRDTAGRVSVRHQGGRQKRFLRTLDWKRDKRGVKAKVEAIEYDPNRTANIALLLYNDGDRRYIVSAEGMAVSDILEAGPLSPIRPGNALPLEQIPVGTSIHNIEVYPGKGGQIVRGAGSFAVIQSKEEDGITVKLPSNEIRKFKRLAYATVGQVARVERPRLGTAGRKRNKGIRPRVRGVAMHPAAHPHGGGEGRSGVGMPSPKTPWGKLAKGVKTRRKRKYSNSIILKRRKIGYGAR